MKNHRLRAGALALVASATLLGGVATGCGGGGSEPDDVVAQYFEAGKDKDYAKLCELLSEDAAAAIVAQDDAESCEAAQESELEGVDASIIDAFEVGDATVDGDTAEVAITALGQEDTMGMVKEGGEWKVDET